MKWKTKVEEAITIRLVEKTDKKVTHQIRDNHKVKAITKVVLRVEEEVIEENLTKTIFIIITVSSMDIMQFNIEETRKKIKKVMQDLQNKKKMKCF